MALRIVNVKRKIKILIFKYEKLLASFSFYTEEQIDASNEPVFVDQRSLKTVSFPAL